MPDRQSLKSGSFQDLNARSWRGQGGDTEERFLEGDDEQDRVAATVDLSETDIDKAISVGFGPEREDEDDLEEGKPRKGAKDELKTDEDRTPQGGDRDDERFSKRTKKRIERERKVTARERQARIEAEQERDALRTRLEAVEKRQSAQDTAQLDAEVQGVETQLTELETRLAKASENDEHAEVAKITRQMQEAATRKVDAQRRRDASQAQRASGKDDQNTNRNGEDKNQRPMDRRAKELLDANSDWWEDDGHFEDRQVILAIDSAVAKDGYKSNTDEYYVEMVRRARAKGLGDLVQLPDFISEDDVKDGDDDGDDEDLITDDPRSDNYRRKKKNGRRPANRGPGGMGNGERRNSGDAQLRREAAGKVTLTQRDMERMTQFRLDPSNKDHVRQWAKSKQDAARQELANRE